MEEYNIQIGPTETIGLQQKRPVWKALHCRIVGTPAHEAVGIALAEMAFAQMHSHAAASFDEVGGILVGQAYEWHGQTHVEVTTSLPGGMTRADPAHVTFTADTWAGLLRRQQHEFPDQMIVGWYHSHPRMDIFLSDMDLLIHHHFFQSAWHIAMVINGQDCKAGFFVWDKGEIRPARGFYWLSSQSSAVRFALQHNHNHFSYDIATLRPEPAGPISVRPGPTSMAPHLTFGQTLAIYLAVLTIIGAGIFCHYWLARCAQRRKR